MTINSFLVFIFLPLLYLRISLALAADEVGQGTTPTNPANLSNLSHPSDTNQNVVIENWLNELETSTEWEYDNSYSAKFPDFSDEGESDITAESFSPEYMKLKKEFRRKVGLRSAKSDGKRIRVQLLKMVLLGYSWSGLAKSCKSPQELLMKTRVASVLTLVLSSVIDFKTQKFIKHLPGAENKVEIAQQSFIGYWRGKTPVVKTVSCLKHDKTCLEFCRRASITIAVAGLIMSSLLQQPTLMYLCCALGVVRYMGEPLVLAGLFGKGNKLRRPLRRPGRLATLLGSPHYSSDF
mmetsp:Transcript_29322/g.38560  ORF Transcript_29322/g.38560 Transcript_29322/m.38560 type:complete len:294 (+) Transcript_29322:65-946(+)